VRTIEKLVNGEWVETTFEQIQHNDRFRILDFGKVKVDSKGRSEFIAQGTFFFYNNGEKIINVFS
jgi:hypothetical protein